MDTSTSSGSTSAKDAAADLAGQAKDAAADALDKAKAAAEPLAEQAKSAAADKLDAGKKQATGALGHVADALHTTSDALRDNDQDSFARYADMAAREVEQFTSAVRGRNVGELLDEAEGFARREPALFLGGAFLLGIFGARFLKAGADGDTNARGLLSQMTLGQGSHEHLVNVNRPPDTAYARDLTQGRAASGSMGSGSMGGGSMGSGSMGSGLSGGNLPADSPAAAGSGSLRTAVGTPGAGADAPIRSGVGAEPLSTDPMSGAGTTGTMGAGGTTNRS